MDLWADDLLEIADRKIDKDEGLDRDAMLETRKWLLSKHWPTKYGNFGPMPAPVRTPEMRSIGDGKVIDGHVEHDPMEEAFDACELRQQTRANSTNKVAHTLRRMAEEYLQEAAELDDGKVPDIGLVDNESGWIDARRKQPAHGQRVLALLPMDNEGDNVEAGQRPCAWIIARWDGLQWDILDAAGNWHGPENIHWWYEVPEAPEGVVIVP